MSNETPASEPALLPTARPSIRRILRAPTIARLALLALGLGGFCVTFANWEMFGPHERPSLQGVDDTGYYLWLRSGVIDHDFNFENDLRAAPTLDAGARDAWLARPRTATGRVANKYPPGWALATLPAFLVGHAFALLTGQPADGWSPPYFVAIWIWHLALAGLGLWWAWRLVTRFAGAQHAAIAVLALWIASPLIYYQAARVSMAHGLLFTLIAGITYQAATLRDAPGNIGRWIAVGALSGLAVLVRATAVVYLVFPAVVYLGAIRRLTASQRSLIAAALFLPAFGAVALTAAMNWAVYGTVTVEPYPGEEFHWFQPALFSVLLSPRHGLFYWHPLILAGLIGLIWAATRRDIPRAWFVSIVAITYVNAAWHAWWFGSSFGNRAFEGVVLYAMVGLGWMLQRIQEAGGQRWARVFGSSVHAATLAGALLLILFVVRAIPREEAVTYADMITATLRPVWQRFVPGAAH